MPSARCSRSTRPSGAYNQPVGHARGGPGPRRLRSCSLLTAPARQALRHMIRNTTLPPRVRAEAQLQLTQMPAYSRPTQIRNRCLLGGKTRGILRDFKLSRVGFPARTRRSGARPRTGRLLTGAVQLPHAGAERQPARRAEGQLVESAAPPARTTETARQRRRGKRTKGRGSRTQNCTIDQGGVARALLAGRGEGGRATPHQSDTNP